MVTDEEYTDGDDGTGTLPETIIDNDNPDDTQTIDEGTNDGTTQDTVTNTIDPGDPGVNEITTDGAEEGLLSGN